MPRRVSDYGKRTLARIQRLCCLGIGSEMLMPDLIREVQGLIPSRHGVFYWMGSDFGITNTYSTLPPRNVESFLKEFLNSDRQTSLLKTLAGFKYWPSSSPVRLLEQILRVDRSTFLRSEFYNVLWRPVEVHETIALCVRSADRVHGLLEFARAPGEAPYGPSDIRGLEAIAGFVGHSMTRTTLREDAYCDSDDRALLVTGSDGMVLYADSKARGLLTMALNPRVSPGTHWRGLGEPIPEVLRLCCMLTATARGEIGQPPPVLRLRNPWGEFILRAYWLGPTDGVERTRQVGITIERRVPRVVALFRQIEDLPLTSREKQLCLLLGRDLSGQDLADAMGLSASTVITHQRSIYGKLGVHSRAELFTALGAGKTGAFDALAAASAKANTSASGVSR